MAVSKLWPVNTNLGYVIDYAANPEKTDSRKYSDGEFQALQDVLRYAENEEKTEQLLFVQGINCSPACARDQFIAVKKRYKKTDGIQAYHGYLSFKEQDITPEEAMQIGMEFAQEVWGKRFQVVVSTHLNTQHLHCHFVVNSVSFRDGLRAHDETSWFRFAPVADRICKEHGLHVIHEAERNQSAGHYKKAEAEGKPTPWSLARAAIDEAVDKSQSYEQLVSELGKMGYSFDFNKRHKYWTIVPKGSVKSVRLYRLGEQYTPDKILSRIEVNRALAGGHTLRGHLRNMQRSSSPPTPVKTYRRTKCTINKMLGYKKHSGLSGLYLHYMYKLGKLPVSRPYVPSKVDYRIRDDLLKLESLAEQTRLLCDNNISTMAELLEYKGAENKKISELCEQRQALRNKLRRNIPETEKEVVRENIENITRELKQLRKNLKDCDDIAERSGTMKERLEEIREEEIQQRKEENEHGYKQRQRRSDR